MRASKIRRSHGKRADLFVLQVMPHVPGKIGDVERYKEVYKRRVVPVAISFRIISLCACWLPSQRVLQVCLQYQSLSYFFCFDSQSPILQDPHLDCSQLQENLAMADLPLSTKDSITTQCLHSLSPRKLQPTRHRLLLRGLGSLPRPDFTAFFRRYGSLTWNLSASGS